MKRRAQCFSRHASLRSSGKSCSYELRLPPSTIQASRALRQAPWPPESGPTPVEIHREALRRRLMATGCPWDAHAIPSCSSCFLLKRESNADKALGRCSRLAPPKPAQEILPHATANAARETQFLQEKGNCTRWTTAQRGS